MKKKEKQSLRSMSDEELGKHVQSLTEQIIKFRLERTTKPVKNGKDVRLLRLTIAVAKTIVRERELVV